MSAHAPSAPAAEPPDRLGPCLLGLLLALAAFTVPRPPALELDASWRMVLGYAFAHGLQWGHDIVFTYGPLGFVMGKTYWGQLFWPMVGWQVAHAALVGWLFVSEGRRLAPLARFFFYAFALLFGVYYEDALQMIVLALLGWRVLRGLDRDPPRADLVAAAVLALYGTIKFTNLLLAGFAVVVAIALAFHRRAPRPAAGLAAGFAGTVLIVWILCGQNPLHLPAYLVSSLEISGGYNDAMSTPSPAAPLRTALLVAGLLAAQLALLVATSPRRALALATAVLAAAFLFLNWKHGFVRADGHMIGFFLCALVVVTGLRFSDSSSRAVRWLRRALGVAAGLLCLVGLEQSIPGLVRGIAGETQARLWQRGWELGHWPEFRQSLRDRMHQQRLQYHLPEVHRAVGDATVDILGFEQALALYNKFNYRPRPVFQSYSAYNAPLARRNLAFFDSAAAPAFVLLKVQTIDGRLATMDDPLVLNYLLHAYDYVLTEKGWQLWRRRPDAPPAAQVAPRPLRTATVAFAENLELGTLAQQPLWLAADARPTLLGRLRKFLYKQPLLALVVEDTAGRTTRYRLPPDAGRTGFILTPLVADASDLMHLAGGRPARRVARFRVETEDGGDAFYRPGIAISLSALAPSTVGARHAAEIERARFGPFGVLPIAHRSLAPLCEQTIDGVPALIAHAPSRLDFVVPAEATTFSGRFGFPPGAHEGEGCTDGAEFRVVWSDGGAERVLFSRHLDPRNRIADRGLQPFSAPLTEVTSGQVSLVIDPGPRGDTGCDWTAWAELEMR